MGNYAPGSPCWVDLGSPDVDASKRFYGELFGWTAETSSPEYGGYTNFFKDGRSVCAVGPLQGPGQPPVWTTYFKSDNLAATVGKVEAAGGKVLTPPMEIAPFGSMAIFLDQAGAAFGVWQPKEMTGADLMGEAGSVVWLELATRDIPGSTEFYPSVLGLSAREVSMGDGSYTLLETGGSSKAGIFDMAHMGMPQEVPPHWMVYFGVEDPDAVAKRATELGGAVTMAPMDTPAGRLAMLTDPHGSSFSVIKGDPDFKP